MKDEFKEFINEYKELMYGMPIGGYILTPDLLFELRRIGNKIGKKKLLQSLNETL